MKLSKDEFNIVGDKIIISKSALERWRSHYDANHVCIDDEYIGKRDLLDDLLGLFNDKSVSEIPSYLDDHETRIKNIEVIKSRVWKLQRDACNLELALTNFYKGMEQDEVRLKEMRNEICWRIQDYEVFVNDYKKDWDLNYEYE